MLLTSIRRAPFIDLPEGNCDFLKEITLFRYSPFFLTKPVPYSLLQLFNQAMAITSISSAASLGRAATWNADLAGHSVLKNSE